MGESKLGAVRREMRRQADPHDAKFLQRYFKTGPGEYAEGDRFLGLRVPAMRRLARSHRDLPRDDLLALLRSPWHEERLLALLVLVDLHRRGDGELRKAILHTYLAHTRFVNNWDLVDLSAPRIVGPHVDPARPAMLEQLARSPLLWERRIAMMATFHWIALRDFRPALRIARMLRDDPHDLIHKAVGWGLREVGKRDAACEERYLEQHAARMPRTMLRYAIERLAPARRAYWLARPRLSAASP